MRTSDKGAPFLQEFRDFLEFLRSLWGILAGISVFFPLSNVLVKVIPLESIDRDGTIVNFSPYLITTISTLTTLFIIFWTFSRRDALKANRGRPGVQRKSLISFGLGFLALIIYLIGYIITGSWAFPVWGLQSDDPRHLFYEVPLLVIYCAFFALITRAFVLLGMIEFYSANHVSGDGQNST